MAVMKKKGEREVPAMSTTSLPDVVYIILFFFMLSTSMRDQELMVKYKLPEATEVQNALTRAYNEVRDDLSMQKFGKKFDDLEEAERKVITKAIPMKISEAEPRKKYK